MKKIELDDFLTNGILREQDFRKKISEINWDLSGKAKKIYFGEPCSAIEIS